MQLSPTELQLRAAKSAVLKARAEGIRVGLIDLKSVWPFPDDLIREVAVQVRSIVVPELNMGQIVHEVERASCGNAHVHSLTRYDGRIITPQEILEKIMEVRSWRN